MSDLILRVSELSSKFGFMDGELVDIFLHDNGVDLDFDNQSILCVLVQRYLIPMIPNIQVDFFETSHNPVRCFSKFEPHCRDSDLFVSISLIDVIETVKDFEGKEFNFE